MLNKTILLLFLLSCVACTTKQSAYLPPARMQQVLFDLHTAEAYSMMAKRDSTHRRNERDTDSLALYYAVVFKHYNVTADQFQESLDWYKKHPEDLDSIYAKMIPELLKLEAKNGN